LLLWDAPALGRREKVGAHHKLTLLTCGRRGAPVPPNFAPRNGGNRWQRERARSLGYRVVRGGVICFPQRFGGSLNLNVHYHAVAPDAAFAKVGERIDAVALQPPTAADLDDVAMNTALRVIDCEPPTW
jgi:hypothetical protein